jgi:hypothetical protein
VPRAAMALAAAALGTVLRGGGLRPRR